MADFKKHLHPTTQFLSALYGRLSEDDNGLIEVRVKNGEDMVAREFCSSFAKVEKMADRYGDRSSKNAVYFGIGKRRTNENGKKSNVSVVPALWSDIDTAKYGWDMATIAKSLHDLPAELQPSILVCSGGGLHAYWLLEVPLEYAGSSPSDWPMEVKQHEDTNNKLAEMCSGDRVSDISRVLRLPGTYNARANKNCHVIWCYPWSTFDYDFPIKPFGKRLGPDGFVTPDKLPVLKTQGIQPTMAATMAYDEGKRGFQARFDALWASTRIGGGFPYHGLDEAIMLATAYLFPRVKDGDDTIVQMVTNEVRKVKERDAPREQWDWDAERQEIKDKLERWKPKYKYILALREAEARVEKKRLAAEKKALKANG